MRALVGGGCHLAAVLVACGFAAAARGAQGPSAHLLVSLAGETKVVLIDVASARVVSSFDAPAAPHEIAVARDGAVAYIADPGSPDATSASSVTVLDLASRTLRGHFDVSPRRQPHDLRVSRDGALLWVACAPDREVVELDARSGEFRRAYDTDADGGWFVAVTPDERKLYVPHLEGRRVTSVDRATGRIATVLEGGAQSGIDVSPDGRRVWVVAHERKRINVIDTATDRVVAGIDLSSDAFGRLRFTPDGARVALVQGRQLTLLDARTHRVIGSIEMPLAGKVPAISPDGGHLAVSNAEDGRVTILSLSPLRVDKTFEVGKTPDGVAWVR